MFNALLSGVLYSLSNLMREDMLVPPMPQASYKNWITPHRTFKKSKNIFILWHSEAISLSPKYLFIKHI